MLDAHGRGASVLAVALAEKLLNDGSENGWVLETYAANLIELGRCTDAEAVLDRAEKVSKKERLPWLIHRRALLEEHRGNYAVALELWKSANAMAPDEATFLIYAASIAFRLGNLMEAEELARMGTRCAEGCPDEAWHNLGRYLAAQKRYDEALFCHEKAIEIDPEYKIAIALRDELLQVLDIASGKNAADE